MKEDSAEEDTVEEDSVEETSDPEVPLGRNVSFNESVMNIPILKCSSMNLKSRRPTLFSTGPESVPKFMETKIGHHSSYSVGDMDKSAQLRVLAFEKKRFGNDLTPTTFDVNEELQINQTSLSKMSGTLFRQSVFKSIVERLSIQKHEHMTWMPSNPGSSIKDQLSYPMFLRWGIIDHRSQFFFIWNIICMVANVLNAIIIPLWGGFYYEGGDSGVGNDLPGIFFFVFLLLSTLLMFTDVVVRCNLTYYAPGGRIVCNRRTIFHKYLKSWFLIDALAGFPYQLFMINPNPPHYGYFELLRLGKFFRIITTDVGFTSSVIQRFMLKHGIRFNLMKVALVKSLILLVIIIHAFACGAYILSNYIGLDSPWISPVENTDSIYAKYFEAFYWATMTSTTTG